MRFDAQRDRLNAAIADTNRELAGQWAWTDGGGEWVPLDGLYRTERAARAALAELLGECANAAILDRVSV